MKAITWGLTLTELVKNFAVVILGSFFSTQVLGVFDHHLVASEGQYRDNGTGLLPASDAGLDIWAGLWAPWCPQKGHGLLYEALVIPLLVRLLKILAFHRRACAFGCFWTSLSILFVFGRTVFLSGWDYAGFFLPFDYKLGRFLKSSGRWPTTFSNSMRGLYAGTCLFLGKVSFQ